MSKNSTMFVTAALMAGVAGAGLPSVALGQSNPVDRVSNPSEYKYSDVDTSLRKLHEPFLRDGVVIEPQRFRSITTGLDAAQVQALIGAPVQRSARTWDYNFKFKMPQSENYLVCQYKVVFGADQAVSSTAWRRRQCQQIAGS